MKRLGLVRHAKSDWGNESLEDIDRHLNARGYQDAKRMALRLKNGGFSPDAFISSTAIRAASTALIFSRAFGAAQEKLQLTPAIYDARTEDLLKVIRKLPDSCQTVFLFGHNPSITEAVNSLSDKPVMHLPTCGVALIEQECTSWSEFKSGRLVLFDFPKNIPGL